MKIFSNFLFLILLLAFFSPTFANIDLDFGDFALDKKMIQIPQIPNGITPPQEFDIERFGTSILLQAGTIHYSRLAGISSVPSSEKGAYLIHYKHVCGAELKSLLTKDTSDIMLLRYIPHNTFLVFAARDSIADLNSHQCVLKVSRFSPRFKLVTDPYEQETASHFAVSIAPFETIQETAQWIETAFIPFLENPQNTLGIQYSVSLSTQDAKTSVFLSDLVPPISPQLDLDMEESVIIPLRIKIASHRKMIISSPETQPIRVLSLVQHSRTLNVHEYVRMSLHNRYSHGIIQSDSSIAGQGLNVNSFSPINGSVMFDPSNVGYQAGVVPLFSANITGQNQIIGCGDSGVDYRHCLFNDTGSMEFNVELSSNRKFIYYETIVDSEDTIAGHGTHVVGTIAGNAYYPADNDTEKITSWYNGAAPDSKIFFQDLGTAEYPSSIFAPDDLATQYFPLPASLGAKIHSNSWGGSFNNYFSHDMEIDEFMYDNPDFLVLFAAGNNGPGLYTLGTPANSKNAIIVGASENTFPAMQQYYLDHFPKITLFEAGNSSNTLNVTGGVVAYYGPKILPFLQTQNWLLNTSIILADPLEACSSLNNPMDYNMKIVLIARGSCSFSEKTLFAQAVNASAILVYNYQGMPVFTMSSLITANYTIPSVMITYQDGMNITNFIASSHYTEFTLWDDIDIVPDSDKDKMAGFSSRGPTPDFRFKPDIVAPGHITLSARASGGNLSEPEPTCGIGGIVGKSGTSMATPVTAGYIALLRQWLNETFSISDPPSATVKALTLTTTKVWQDVGDTSISPGASPNVVSGFGRLDGSSLINQSTSFYFHNDTMPPTPGTIQSLCYEVLNPNETADYIFTLVWTDPPGFPGAAMQLIHNLDLIVETPLGVYLGNNLTFSTGSNIIYQRDIVNNVEQIRINSSLLSPGDPISIRVSNGLSGISAGASQNYSLVLFGNYLVNGNCSGLSSGCPNDCSSHGTCIDSICHCEYPYAGAGCGNNITVLTNGSLINSTVFDWSWDYFEIPSISSMYNVKQHKLSPDSFLNITLLPNSNYDDPDFYLSFSHLPNLVQFDHRSVGGGITDRVYIVQTVAQGNKLLDENTFWEDPIIIVNLDSETEVFIGVHGACCQNTRSSAFTLSLEYTLASVSSPLLPDLWWVWVIVAFVSCSLIIGVYRHYQSIGAAATDVENTNEVELKNQGDNPTIVHDDVSTGNVPS